MCRCVICDNSRVKTDGKRGSATAAALVTQIEGYRVTICADTAGTDCHPCLGDPGGEGTIAFPAKCD